MLQFDQVHFTYGAKAILTGFDWQLSAGKIHGLVGLNGAGKTTLLHLMSGRLQRPKGRIAWRGKDLRPTDLALMEAEPYFYPRITGREYLQILDHGSQRFDIEGWAAVFALPLNEWIETYSSGMKKQLALLGVLALGPRLLLLDEPLRAVDVAHVEKMKYIFQQLRATQHTLLITSHNLEALIGVADTISLLVEGKIALQVEKAEFPKLVERVQALLSEQDQQQIEKLIQAP